mmetsp:Transcript_24792/g.57780  ORF Transcript_24792/g.57780 Transcript_24792/m.57780 type:complete len:108 (-) Transcript_24792:1081-1404(-)
MLSSFSMPDYGAKTPGRIYSHTFYNKQEYLTKTPTLIFTSKRTNRRHPPSKARASLLNHIHQKVENVGSLDRFSDIFFLERSTFVMLGERPAAKGQFENKQLAGLCE